MRLRIDFQQIDIDLTSLAGVPIPDEPAEMAALGQKLYRALDGPSRRLDGLAPNSTIELACKPDSPALHLAWELLHDGDAFLVQRGIIPVRVVLAAGKPAPVPPPVNRPLNVLFMACSPRNVRPVLAFEREERIFLDATERQPIYLTPEETGNINELSETIRDNNPFDVFHLTGHGDLFDPDAHKEYLRPGQTIPTGKPVLLTENDAGRCELATAEDLERAFGERLPRLVFLSGCRTSEKPEEEGPSPLVQDLLARGFPAVLGWASPVYDSSATLAAAHLYKETAAGQTVEQALRHTLRELTRPAAADRPFQIPDWHLLRLFSQPGHVQAALVTPPNHAGRAPFVPPRREDGFLDKEGKMKVAGGGFVGRRRSLQRTLPAFEVGSGHTGVVVWGLGGLGKSSLAARLCDRVERRRPVFRRAVLQGVLDEARLVALLTEKYDDHDALPELTAAGSRPLSGRLKRFFERINTDAPLLLVLDDFEQNIDLDVRAPEGFLLKRAAFDALAAVDKALGAARAQSRLMVTSRHFSVGAFPPGLGLLAEQLPQMDREDLRKKARGEVKESVAGEDLVARALGNPKLFEWLADAHAKGDLAQATELFQRWLKVPELLAGLTAAERRELARLSVFQLPVPESVAREVGGDAGEFARAIGLGLAERTEAVTDKGEPLLETPAMVRPLLEEDLAGDELRTCSGVAARAVHRAWWESKGGVSEAQMVEMVRLATQGSERAIACDLMQRLAIAWNQQSRYRETVQWGRRVLEQFEDYRLLSSVAVAERVVGDTASAAAHLERAQQLQPDGDERERAFALHEMAVLRAQQGDVAGALQLYGQSLEIEERIGNAQGKAATLHQMAGLRAQQGDVAGALQLYSQVSAIDEQTGDVRGKAATLHQMAGLRAQQGDVAGALQLYGQSLEIKERIGNAQGKAATLHEMAVLRAQQGDVAGALQLYSQVSAIDEQTGDVRGKAATLHQMAGLRAQQGDVAGALQFYGQSLEIEERIGNAQGKAATLHEMAGLREQQGDVAGALQLYGQSLEIYERIGDAKGKATTLHNMAGLRAQQGDVPGALQLYGQSLEIKERIGDAKGKAATLHQMAGLRAQQGDVAGALQLYGQSLEIKERIGNAKGKAATLHAMAGLRAQQGDVPGALQLYGQSLEIEERIGNAKGKAATLHAMAGLRAQQGDVPGALQLYGQSLEIQERIGNVHGKAATLNNMAALAHKQGDQAEAVRYSREAAGAVAEARAWPDLLTVLGNLSAADVQERRLYWLGQAVWLAVALGMSTPASLRTAAALFHAVPTAHPLELRLAALAGLVFARHGPEELRAKNLEQANQLLGIAARNQGMTPEAARAWFEEQIRNPGALLRDTLTELEALVGDNEAWIYDRRAVLASRLDGAQARAAAATGDGTA